MHQRLARATDGMALTPLTWTMSKDLITPHPLGGCNLGRTAADGVVGHNGEVFGHRNLYVADGAIVPKAIGLNPSRTIGALAERVAALIVADSR
jgi:cholesterol oxidase